MRRPWCPATRLLEQREAERRGRDDAAAAAAPRPRAQAPRRRGRRHARASQSSWCVGGALSQPCLLCNFAQPHEPQPAPLLTSELL